MKKFLALFAATLMLLAVITGCKSKETSASASSGAAKAGDTSAAQANIDVNKASDDDCFTWQGTTITGFTEKGSKQETLIYPKKATNVLDLGSIDVIKAKTIAFQNPDIKFESAAFNNCKELTTFIFPSHLTEIKNAFLLDCTALKNISIPETVTKIEGSAFQGCTALETITIPKNIKEIGNFTFQNCTSLKSINLPDSLTAIGECAFKNCTALQTINAPKSLTIIKDSAFYQCKSLTSFVVPENVTEIGHAAFFHNANMKSITIPAAVTKIGSDAFSTGTDSDKPTIIKVKKDSYADKSFDEVTDEGDCNCKKEYY